MSFIVYPALDIREGRVVRLLQGDYAQQINYDADPVATDVSAVAARTLLQAVAGAEVAHIELSEPTLIVRESTGPVSPHPRGEGRD